MAAWSGTVLGFDVGSKRVGLAVAQSITRQARPLTILERNGAFSERLSTVLAEYKPSVFVVGLPLDKAGNNLPSVNMVERFVERFLSGFGLPIEWINECYTTKLAQSCCTENNIKRSKTQLDDVSAHIILSAWLDKQDTYA